MCAKFQTNPLSCLSYVFGFLLNTHVPKNLSLANISKSQILLQNYAVANQSFTLTISIVDKTKSCCFDFQLGFVCNDLSKLQLTYSEISNVLSPLPLMVTSRARHSLPQKLNWFETGLRDIKRRILLYRSITPSILCNTY